MGTPFAGYVRDPGSVSDHPTPDSVRSAIHDAAAEYGVPEDAMLYMWRIEAAGNADPYQEVGINSSGYGGFFGLPSNLIGDTRAQTRTVASLLSTYHAQTGSWAAAMNIYNTGQPDIGYGSQYESGAQVTRTSASNIPDAPISDTKAQADASAVATVTADPPALVQLPTVSFPSLPDPHIALRAEGAVADRVVPMLFVAAFVLLVIVVVMEGL